MLFFYRQLDYVANAKHRPALLTFAEEAVGGLAGVTVFPLVYLAAIRFPIVSARWRRNLLANLAAVCLISIVHTTAIALYRVALFPLLGFGNEGYGYIPVRYPMEFSHLFIYYWVALSIIYLFHEVRFAREREVHAAKLESSLAEAQLQNLRLQLEPHFLFNALNAISAAIYDDPRVADEMIGRLGDLLRQLFKEERSQLISLDRELEMLQLYTRIMEARLEDRLSIQFQIEDAAKEALVPQLILQPLVENAIRHGMDGNFQVNMVIGAQCETGSLLLSVRDHGPGIDKSRELPSGIGLQNTRNRLARLFPNQYLFEIGNAEGGGAIVNIQIPFQSIAQAEPRLAASLAR